jgi:hypothetical protein
MHPSKNAIDFAGAVRDWISSPHDPDEDLDLQLAQLTQAHFEALFEACRYYEQALEFHCECEREHKSAATCPQCEKVEMARKLWGRFAEATAKLNPDWTESLELELEREKDHRDAWLWAYSALISIIEQRPGWDKCKPEYQCRRSEETLQFPAITQVIGFVRSFLQLERRLNHVESLLADGMRYKIALDKILKYPVHSEPVGGAYAMQDIALEALEPKSTPQ